MIDISSSCGPSNIEKKTIINLSNYQICDIEKFVQLAILESGIF